MIKKDICIKNYQDRSLTGTTWGSLFGLTDNGNIVYYTGQTTSSAYIAKISILLTQSIDDLGVYASVVDDWKPRVEYYLGDYTLYLENSYKCVTAHTSDDNFNNDNWINTLIDLSTGQTVTFTGSTKINEFRRYGKSENDPDLYNSVLNTGFSQIISTSNGILKQIISEREKSSGLDKQNLYDYKIWVSGNTGTTLTYYDINTEFSEIKYNSKGLNKENAVNTPKIKLDHLIGVISEPKINVDVFIDRGANSSFDRHMRLGEIRSLSSLENYGNGYFKIKEI